MAANRSAVRQALWFCLAWSLACNCCAARVSKKVKKTQLYVIFGDSVTDQGNTFKLSNGTVPSPSVYSNGRFSNGPVWVDYLAQAIGKKHKVKVLNYATGAATACPPGPLYSTYNSIMRDGDNQTTSFLADKAAGKVPSKNVAPVFIFYLGANDLAESFYTVSYLTAGVQSTIMRIVGCRVEAARTLAEKAGAKDILVMPLGPLQLSSGIPAMLRPIVANLVDSIDNATAGYLAMLQANFSIAPKATGLRSVRLRLLGGSSKWLLDGVAALGFNDTSEPCVDDQYPMRPKPAALPVCSDPRDHMFYTPLHPVTEFHKWVALKGVLPRLQRLGLAPKKL